MSGGNSQLGRGCRAFLAGAFLFRHSTSAAPKDVFLVVWEWKHLLTHWFAMHNSIRAIVCNINYMAWMENGREWAENGWDTCPDNSECGEPFFGFCYLFSAHIWLYPAPIRPYPAPVRRLSGPIRFLSGPSRPLSSPYACLFSEVASLVGKTLISNVETSCTWVFNLWALYNSII